MTFSSLFGYHRSPPAVSDEQGGVAVHDRLGSLDLRHQAVEGLPTHPFGLKQGPPMLPMASTRLRAFHARLTARSRGV